MSRIIATVVATTFLLAACDKLPLSFAGKAKPAPPAMAVLDMVAVAKALGRDEVAREQMEAANRQLQQQLSEVSSGLQDKLREEQSRLGETPSEEQQQKFQRLALDAQRQLQQTQALARQRSTQFQNQLATQFRAEVQPVAADVAAQHGASTVMMANTLLWFAPAVDITGEVIDAMRARASASPAAPDTKAVQGEAAGKTQ